jgi:hypothetical protein
MAAETKRAEVVTRDEDVAGRFRIYLEELDYDVRVNPGEEPVAGSDLDLVIYHVPPDAMKAERRQSVRPQAAGREPSRFWMEAVHHISVQVPAAQILVAVAPGEDAADRALDSGATDVIEYTVTPGIFRRRLELLEAFRQVGLSVQRISFTMDEPAVPPAAGPPASTAVPRRYDAVLELPLPELRNEHSGRIDAQAVATYLRIPLKRLAEAAGIRYQGLHKTPDSIRAEASLAPIVRVLELANRAFGNAETVRRWLNRPLHELEDDTPLAVILAGEAEAVETLLRNALTGIPG